MTKKNLIALADAIKQHNKIQWADNVNREFNAEQLEAIANALATMNPKFMRERWLGYIAGENGANGGAR